MIALSDEAILFGTLFAMPLVWALLKVLIDHLIDLEVIPKKTRVPRRAA